MTPSTGLGRHCPEPVAVRKKAMTRLSSFEWGVKTDRVKSPFTGDFGGVAIFAGRSPSRPRTATCLHNLVLGVLRHVNREQQTSRQIWDHILGSFVLQHFIAYRKYIRDRHVIIFGQLQVAFYLSPLPLSHLSTMPFTFSFSSVVLGIPFRDVPAICSAKDNSSAVSGFLPDSDDGAGVSGLWNPAVPVLLGLVEPPVELDLGVAGKRGGNELCSASRAWEIRHLLTVLLSVLASFTTQYMFHDRVSGLRTHRFLGGGELEELILCEVLFE